MREHPADGELQALLDDELPRARVVMMRAHLLRCDSCRARIEAARATSAMVNALVRRSTPAVDSASAWARLVVLSGGRAESGKRGWSRWPSAAALALATAALIVAIVRGNSRSVPGDDGLLTLSTVGEKVTVVIVYEDVDHSGTFTRGDIVRYVSTIPHKAPAAPLAH